MRRLQDFQHKSHGFIKVTIADRGIMADRRQGHTVPVEEGRLQQTKTGY